MQQVRAFKSEATDSKSKILALSTTNVTVDSPSIVSVYIEGTKRKLTDLLIAIFKKAFSSNLETL